MRRRYEARCPECGHSFSSDREGGMECGHGRWVTSGYPVALTSAGTGKPWYLIPAWTPYEYDAAHWRAL